MTKRVEVNIDELNIIDDFSASVIILLSILFGILKLTGVIHWSWLWVLSPIWIPILTIVAIAVVTLVIILIASLIAALLSR